jgi:glucose uptake protein
MILPSSYAVTLALIVLGMLCWGSWASLYKATGKLRYELFYFDFAIGLCISALICAFTFGSFGFDGFTFMDDLIHAGKKQDLIGLLAGAVFSLGNMLLLAAVAEAGMATAFPIGIGVAIVIGSAWQIILKPGENLALLLAGCVAIIFGVIVATAAYRAYMLSRVDDLVRTGQQKTTKRQVSPKGAAIAIVGGLILGSFMPLVSDAMSSEIGVGPYSLCVMFALGAFFSTFFFNLFFMNLPITGAPLEIFDYFKLTGRQHLLALISGVVWMCGLLASLISAAAEGGALVGSALSYGLFQGSVLIATLWGLLYWKEFAGADTRVRSMLLVMLVLLVCGIGMIAIAPVVKG